MTNLSLHGGMVPIRNTGNVNVIILVDFPTKEVFQAIYKKHHNPDSIERHYAIVKMRSEGYTLKRCGDEFGITKERVRQVEAKFLRKMRVYTSSLRTDSL